MKKLSLTRNKLKKLYLKEMDIICELNEFKTHFEPEEICDIIYTIIEKELNKK